jgi:hypothetical protein
MAYAILPPRRLPARVRDALSTAPGLTTDTVWSWWQQELEAYAQDEAYDPGWRVAPVKAWRTLLEQDAERVVIEAASKWADAVTTERTPYLAAVVDEIHERSAYTPADKWFMRAWQRVVMYRRAAAIEGATRAAQALLSKSEE